MCATPRLFKLAKKTRATGAKANRRINRVGIAAVEFAVVAPLLILMIFMMVEVSRYLMALHATTGAARSAARATAIAGVSSSDAEQIAKDYMQNSSFSPDTVVLNVDTSPSGVANMDRTVCTVTINFDDVSIVGNPFNIGATVVTGNSAMLAPTNSN